MSCGLYKLIDEGYGKIFFRGVFVEEIQNPVAKVTEKARFKVRCNVNLDHFYQYTMNSILMSVRNPLLS